MKNKRGARAHSVPLILESAEIMTYKFKQSEKFPENHLQVVESSVNTWVELAHIHEGGSEMVPLD